MIVCGRKAAWVQVSAATELQRLWGLVCFSVRIEVVLQIENETVQSGLLDSHGL